MTKPVVVSSVIVAVMVTIVANLTTLYETNRPAITDKITEMALNGSDVRDIGRVLGISITTVIVHLKNLSRQPFRLSHSTKLVTKLA